VTYALMWLWLCLSVSLSAAVSVSVSVSVCNCVRICHYACEWRCKWDMVAITGNQQSHASNDITGIRSDTGFSTWAHPHVVF